MMLGSEDERRLLEAVQTYERVHRHPDRPAFIVHQTETAGDKDVKGSWEGAGPSSRPGCYVLFSEAGAILYVGKASHGRTVGGRLVRFRYKGSDWPEKPAYVRIVEVTDSFEAPSLEEFLINVLQPPHNKHGVEFRH